MSEALSFERVCVGFSGRAALDGLSLRIPAGTLIGIVGPNGAGKTTFLRAALGLVRAQSGSICIQNAPLSDWSRTRLARVASYLPQGGAAHWPILAREAVMLGRLPHIGPFKAPGRGDRAAVEEALMRCDAIALADRRMDALSAGERARVLMARALATRTDLLLADEPAAFLDPAQQLRLMALLRGEAARGACVVATLHDLSLAARHCDRVVVLDHGRLAAEGAPHEALSDTVLARVFAIARDVAPGFAFRPI